MCWRRAALGGGKLSVDLPLVVNMCFLAKFTVVSVQVQSYKSTTNASNTDMQSLLSSDGSVNKVENTGVTSMKDFHMSNAVFFFPCQQTTTQCHNRKGMEHGKGECLFISKFFSDVMRKKYLRSLPVTKATQISVSSGLTTVDTARTTTSVSTVRKMILRYPLFNESTA